MEDFKLKLFKEEYGFAFPKYYHLSDKDLIDIRYKLFKQFDVLDGLSLIHKLYSLQHFVQNMNANDEVNFNLVYLLNSIGLNSMKKVYLNWSQFNNIDLFDFDDFNKYFYDIWFPAADDIILFDKTFSWFIFIYHYGSISYFKSNVE